MVVTMKRRVVPPAWGRGFKYLIDITVSKKPSVR